MMNCWIDIACIVFVCVTMNHLGLIGEIEHIYGHRLKVVNCPKCATFWATLLYCLWGISSFYGDIILVLAISFLASYIAIWLELLEGIIDTLYNKVYEKIFATDGDVTDPASPEQGNPDGSVSEL